jgi:hypothetical protein
MGAIGRKGSNGRGMEYRDGRIFLLGGTKNVIAGNIPQMLYVYDVFDPANPSLVSNLSNQDPGWYGVTDMISLFPFVKYVIFICFNQ